MRDLISIADLYELRDWAEKTLVKSKKKLVRVWEKFLDDLMVLLGTFAFMASIILVLFFAGIIVMLFFAYHSMSMWFERTIGEIKDRFKT